MRAAVYLVALGLTVASAEQLPLKIYTAADGLAHNSVHRIVRDSRGYMWFCTSEGLSRFDGYEFHNYGRRDGLPHRDIRDLMESRTGDFWAATGSGLCRFRPSAPGPLKFQIYRVPGNQRASYINSVMEDSRGQIWCGTDAGLFRVPQGSNDGKLQAVDLGMPDEAFSHQMTPALLEDSRGEMWVGAGSGLYRLSRSGHVERYTIANGLPDNFITTLFEDRDKRLWAGTGRGLGKLVADPQPGRPIVEHVYREADGLGADYIRGMHQLRDGTLCVGTAQGLAVHLAGSPENAFRTYTTSNGLSAMIVEGLAEDTDGNLWIGLDDGGAAKLAWHTFLTYNRNDGLLGTQVDSIYQTADGTLRVVTRRGATELFLNELHAGRFVGAKLHLPPRTPLLDWGARTQNVAEDRAGNWWVATGEGLMRFNRTPDIPELAEESPRRVSIGEQLKGDTVFSVYEDAQGDLWVSTTGRKNGLTRLDRGTHAVHRYSEAEGLPPLRFGGVSLFAGDNNGDLWMGLFRFAQGQPGLLRFRAGRFRAFTCGQGAPGGGVRALHFDRAGRLWVGTTQNGVLVVNRPSADEPQITSYSMANGLSSDIILSLTEDRRGRIYIGTGGGVDRLDPQTGQIKRFTSADGLVPGEVQAEFCDRDGTLWFGTSAGISRLRPEEERVAGSAAPVYITAMRVAGVRQPVADSGATELTGLRLEPNQDHIQFDFVGLDYAPGERLRYQFKLEQADADWSAPAELRSVNYANLAPGAYRFAVRAVNSSGIASSRPASVSFVLLPPLWMRWWFRLTLACGAAGIIYALHRYRVVNLLRLERIRTRIATDLHDDIGSSLAQIAILSEVARRDNSSEHANGVKPLADIASISRELVDSMSDIVWAVDPDRDHFGDLVHRMRRFASDLFAAGDIRLEFQAPAGELHLDMGADLRREIFRIYKEALHNVLRHSGASELRIRLAVDRGWLNLEVRDNGRGFDLASANAGHGLKSIRERAARLGGKAEIESHAGNGTLVRLRLHLGQTAVSRLASRLPI